MSGYRRYAVYHLPEGALARAAALWLGWDPVAGESVLQPVCSGFDVRAATEAPRRYGFHATMRAPFRLRDGIGPDLLSERLAAFCRGTGAVAIEGGLVLARPAGFVALVPGQESPALHRLESTLVEAMDPLRAPLGADEIARRNPAGLNPAQRANLDRWGYPFVRDQFRFHMTLTGPLEPELGERVMAELRRRLPEIPNPYPLGSLSLMGEAAAGRFHELLRLPLGGP